RRGSNSSVSTPAGDGVIFASGTRPDYRPAADIIRRALSKCIYSKCIYSVNRIDVQGPSAALSEVLHCGSGPTVALATVPISYSPVPEIMTDQLAKKSAAWSGRFSEPVSELVKRYTASVGFDQRLAMQDID